MIDHHNHETDNARWGGDGLNVFLHRQISLEPQPEADHAPSATADNLLLTQDL
jgi:hypothetical protein